MAGVHVATDTRDAIEFLAAHGGRALAVAGGTDLVIDRRLGRVDPEWLVDLSRVDALRGITRDGDRVTIGALTRIRAIELDGLLAARATALVEAAALLGSVQIRNMATIGGNICHATPSAEMPPPLLVHDATAEIVGPSGSRTVDLGGVFAGPGRTTLAPGELLVALRLHTPAGSGSCYLRQTVRWAMDLAGVGVAAAVQVRDGVVTGARIALGAVSPEPLRVPDAERALVGRPFDAAVAETAGELAADACSPISDARGPAEYRRTVVGVLVARALRVAWLRASGDWPPGLRAPANGVLSGDAP